MAALGFCTALSGVLLPQLVLKVYKHIKLNFSILSTQILSTNLCLVHVIRKFGALATCCL